MDRIKEAARTLGVEFPDEYARFMKLYDEKLSDDPLTTEGWIPELGSLGFVVGSTLAFRSKMTGLGASKVIVGYRGTRLVEKVNEEIDVYYLMDTRDGRLSLVDYLGITKPLDETFEQWAGPRLLKAELKDKYRSHLIVIGFDDEGQAEALRSKVLDMHRDGWVKLEDAVAAVKNPEGGLAFRHTPALSGDKEPTFLERLVNAIFAPSFEATRSRSYKKRISNTFSRIGLHDPFVRETVEALKPSSSALFVLCRGRPRSDKADAVLEELLKFKGKLLVTSLSDRKEAILQEAVETLEGDPPTRKNMIFE